MEFTRDGDSISGGGGNALTALMAGSLLNRDDDKGKTSTMMIVLAVVFFVIVFIIALVFLAMAFKDKGYDHRREAPATDIAALLTPLIAAKSMDGNCNRDYDHDHLEIKSQIDHLEDRRTMSDTQREIQEQGKSFMQLGFGLSNQIKDTEVKGLENFAKLENQIGMLQMGQMQLLQKANNSDIINGVIQQLMCGKPCVA